MDDYWHAISEAHQQKLSHLADTHGVTTQCVLRNILRHMKWELGQMSRIDGFQHFITARKVEQMIDLIAR
ncbi:MAG: hypothetical protein ABIL58_15910 [Pseudomonadota bacterium]